jgi:hypothetical protein
MSRQPGIAQKEVNVQGKPTSSTPNAQTTKLDTQATIAPIKRKSIPALLKTRIIHVL